MKTLKNGFRRIRSGLLWDGRRWARLEVCLPGVAPGTWSRRRKKVKATTLAEAEAAHRQFKDAVQNPTVAKPVVNETFEAYVRKNWPISRDKRRPLSSEVAYREWSALTSRIFPAIGRLRFDQITESVIEDFAAGLLLRKSRPATVNNRMRIVRKVLAHAVRRADQVCPALRTWPASMKEDDVRNELTPEETRAYLDAFSTGVVRGGAGGQLASDYMTGLFRAARPLFVAAIDTGLARKDLLDLRWSEVDAVPGFILRTRAKTGIVSEIPISDRLRAALNTCRSRAVVDTTLVFTTPDGSPYSISTVGRYHRAALKFAGITRRVRFHDLRHSVASFLVSREVPLEKVAKMLGHSSIAVTKRYARVSAASMATVTRALNSR